MAAPMTNAQAPPSDVADLVRRLIQDANFMEFIGRRYEAEYEHLRPEPPKAKSSWHDMARTLREAADALAPRWQGWLPIAMAPKDGTNILAWDTRPFVATWHTANYCWLEVGTSLSISPTAFQPLPTPPAETT